MYSMSCRATSPSDQPAYRPKLRTVPDGRPGGGPAAPCPSGARIDSSKPDPVVDRPDVQSRETTSGGGVVGGGDGVGRCVGAAGPPLGAPAPGAGAAPSRPRAAP